MIKFKCNNGKSFKTFKYRRTLYIRYISCIYSYPYIAYPITTNKNMISIVFLFVLILLYCMKDWDLY